MNNNDTPYIIMIILGLAIIINGIGDFKLKKEVREIKEQVNNVTI